MTETFEPYRPDSSYDLDYDDEQQPRQPGRVLWGRVAILGVALLIAFLLGRVTAGDSGIERSQYNAVVAEREALEEENADLERQLAAAPEPTPLPTASPVTGGGGGGGDSEATDPEGETEGGETYTVEQGDTLASIAEEFYGNASLDDFLAEANGITDPESLAVGQELIIPPEPEE
ncbi:MAG TPA: LysM peptidoglycan-binding domain-containing protein [Actinomycetota bacterium]|nr:LysM peptidoglycan-binding domain-containing protein [Actinomycetota bacterium]